MVLPYVGKKENELVLEGNKNTSESFIKMTVGMMA